MCGFDSRLKKSAARPAGSRSARRRGPTHRRALPRAAERFCRRRAAPQPRLSADCDLSYLLLGVFSAPASGVFEHRADPRRRPADLRLLLLLLLLPGFLVYFTELVYTSIKISVNEFYVKRKKKSASRPRDKPQMNRF